MATAGAYQCAAGVLRFPEEGAMTTTGGTDGDADLERPVLPAGRYVWLPGRGRTFVRELAGPEGAPTVVLLHGWTATADLNWWACYEPLCRSFHVVALDHRAHGRGLRAPAPFRLEHCADDVAALVEALGLRRVIAVGYSMGGPVAQLLWRRHRDVVAGLVLCATAASFGGTVRERVLAGVATGTLAVGAAVPLGRLAGAAISTWRGRRAGRASTWWGLEEVARHDWRQIIEAGREILRFDSRPWVGAVDVPSAVLVTDEDTVVPRPRQRDLAGRIDGAAVWPVRGGHAVCTTTPERFVPALVAACHTVAAGAGVPSPVAPPARAPASTLAA